MRYAVTFEKLGRGSKGIGTLEVEAADARDLTALLLKHAGKFLASRDVGIDLHPHDDEQHGTVKVFVGGMRVVGWGSWAVIV